MKQNVIVIDGKRYRLIPEDSLGKGEGERGYPCNQPGGTFDSDAKPITQEEWNELINSRIK